MTQNPTVWHWILPDVRSPAKFAKDARAILLRSRSLSHLGISVISLAHVGNAVRSWEETRNDKDCENCPPPLSLHPLLKWWWRSQHNLYQGLESRIDRPQASHHPDPTQLNQLTSLDMCSKGTGGGFVAAATTPLAVSGEAMLFLSWLATHAATPGGRVAQ